MSDCIHTGTALTPLLFEVLLLLTMKPVALVGDVNKAFLQIEVAEKERYSFWFLWTEDPAVEDPGYQGISHHQGDIWLRIK